MSSRNYARVYADTPNATEDIGRLVDEIAIDARDEDAPWAIVVFEREEAKGGRAYLQAELYVGTPEEIELAIQSLIDGDDDRDITTESWCERTSDGLTPAEIGFEDPA